MRRIVSPLSATAVALVLSALVLGARGPSTAAADDTSPASPPSRSGEQIWKQDCAACHGDQGAGSFQGPSIRDAGAADVDFMVRTGRMPLPPEAAAATLRPSAPRRDSDRRPSAYTGAEIQDLVRYTGSFITGPSVPAPPDLSGADVANGGETYRLNCSGCHQMAGSGGALAYGVVAPPLTQSSPTDVVEAMRVGPGSMPNFPEPVLDDAQARDVAAYVQQLHQPDDRGGLALWHIGPVGEGLVAWLFGAGMAVLLCRWLGERSRA